MLSQRPGFSSNILVQPPLVREWVGKDVRGEPECPTQVYFKILSLRASLRRGRKLSSASLYMGFCPETSINAANIPVTSITNAITALISQGVLEIIWKKGSNTTYPGTGVKIGWIYCRNRPKTSPRNANACALDNISGIHVSSLPFR